MSNLTKLYLIRHGESEANVHHICGSDSPLTDRGRQQAIETKELLRGIRFSAAYSSDLQRAIETAQIIYGQPIPASSQFTGLRERDFGPLNNKPEGPWLDLKNAYERKYAALPFADRIEHEYAADIEGDRSLRDRVMTSLQQIATANNSKTVLVAAHAGPIRVVLMDLKFVDFMTVGSFKNAGYIELNWDGEKFTVQNVIGIQDPTAAT